MNQQEFWRRFPEAREGSTVWTRDGIKLGRVISVDESSLVIEHGIFFREDFSVAFEDIAEIRNGEFILSRNREELSGERAHMPPVGAASGYADEEKRELKQAITGQSRSQ